MEDYRFGYYKPKFNGTVEEWNQLRNTIAWQHESLSIYSSAMPSLWSNQLLFYNLSLNTHKQCQLHKYQMEYECPGYKIGIYMD